MRAHVTALAGALLLVATSTPLAAAQVTAPGTDLEGPTVESYLAQVDDMQAPLFAYIEAYPEATTIDEGFAAGFTPLLQDAALVVTHMSPPECLEPMHQHVLLDTEHRLAGYSAVLNGEYVEAYEHLQLAEEAGAAALEAFDSAICEDAVAPVDEELSPFTMTPDEYQDGYVLMQLFTAADAGVALEDIVYAKTDKKRIKGYQKLVRVLDEQAEYLDLVDPHPCFADIHDRYDAGVRGWRKYAKRALEAARKGNWNAELKNFKKAGKQREKAAEAFDASACIAAGE